MDASSTVTDRDLIIGRMTRDSAAQTEGMKQFGGLVAGKDYGFKMDVALRIQVEAVAAD